MELFKQPQYSPYPTEEQVVSIWLGTTGQLDSIAVTDVGRFEREFLDHLRRTSSVLKSIAETNKFSDDTAASLQSEVDSFKQEFASGDGGGIQVAPRNRRLPRTRTSSRSASSARSADDELIEFRQLVNSEGRES